LAVLSHAAEEAMPFLALQGIRVLEIATGIAGPFCDKMLADYGAEVIKVERPRWGDSSRHGGSLSEHEGPVEQSALFLHLNTNKKGVTLDLTNSGGQDLFRRLAADSQILIESFSPGAMESMGIGFHTLKQLRPDLVMTSVTPFGQTGPHKDYQFTELTIFAAGGAMYREGSSGREPLKYGGEMAQYYAGVAAASATTAASFKAFMTGQGEWIDMSIQECMAGHPHQAGRRAPFAYSGDLDVRTRPRSPEGEGREAYAVGTFRCKGGYVSFLPLGPRMWPNLARMIDKPGLTEEARFSTPEDRGANSAELEGIFQDWFDSHTWEEVLTAVQREGLPCGPVLTTDQVLSNEHFRDREYFVDISHPDAGDLAYPGPPFRLSNAPQEEDKPAPRLGQHTGEVFSRISHLG
jgi:CoA:oxalate CoA-transferase